jgi:small subunit ribosomal protein S18
MAKASTKRGKNKDNARRSKKKTSILTIEHVEYVDYKDVNLLRRFMSDRAKIRARRVTGNDAQQQREVARAIKNAREMALLPYTNRITTQRGKPDRRDRDDRPPRDRSRDDAELEGDEYGAAGEGEGEAGLEQDAGLEVEAELDVPADEVTPSEDGGA